ncbi:MAG: HlyD family type I secretion periplasmic adaptor subunit, partial [Alphaproteobacteria bacterium]|nr:HlyD family type I secretion periplasmic adaptor subunit [Alphaproteobacteria bacterium]
MSLQTISQNTLPARPLTVSMTDNPGKPSWAGASRFGYMVILLFFGGLGGWAAFAPLASGVNVSGSIEVETGVKTVQHLEGGLVKEILVREGDRVTKGEVVLRMDPLRSDAQSIVQRSSLLSLLVERARITAEVAGEEAVNLDGELMDALEQPVLRTIVESELKLFEERKDSRARQIEIRQERIAQTETELRALDIRLSTVKEGLSFIDEELDAAQKLYDKRLTTKSRLLAVKRARVGLHGQEGTILETVARTKQRIAEQKLMIQAEKQNQRTANFSRLNQLDPEITKRREGAGVLQAQINRIEVKSPANGRVMNLRVKTAGQVISYGQVLMEIVPDKEAMVLRGKLKSKDIEQVKQGAMVKVRLAAFNPRLTPPVDGQLISITPTTITAGKGRPTYGVTIKLDPISLNRAI